MTDEQKLALLTRMRAMSAADLSILQGVLDEPPGDAPILVTTRPGSENNALWTEMAALGWMSAAPPLDVPVPSKVFVVNAAAKAPVAELLDELRRDAMTRLLNEVRSEVPPWLTRAVHEGNGTPGDLAMMLGAIVEGTMRRAIKSELHDEFLSEVFKMAERMRGI